MQQYAVVIHEEPDGGYWGEVPALPGCYSQGETRQEALTNIADAVELHVEGLEELPESNEDVALIEVELPAVS